MCVCVFVVYAGGQKAKLMIQKRPGRSIIRRPQTYCQNQNQNAAASDKSEFLRLICFLADFTGAIFCRLGGGEISILARLSSPFSETKSAK